MKSIEVYENIQHRFIETWRFWGLEHSIDSIITAFDNLKEFAVIAHNFKKVEITIPPNILGEKSLKI